MIKDGTKEFIFQADCKAEVKDGITERFDTHSYFNGIKTTASWGGRDIQYVEQRLSGKYAESREVLIHYLPIFDVSPDQEGLDSLVRRIDSKMQAVPVNLFFT